MVITLEDTGVIEGIAFENVDEIEKDQIEGKEVIVKDWAFRKSADYGDFVVILLELDGKEYKAVMGSGVVINILKGLEEKGFKEKAKEEGLKCTFRKVDHKTKKGYTYWIME